MTQWIQTSNTNQNGTPVTRAISISGMGEEIFFTDNAYAEVSDDVADLLASQLDDISKVIKPRDPGEYYGDAGQNTTVEIILPDSAFDSFTAESGDIDALTAEQIATDESVTVAQDDTITYGRNHGNTIQGDNVAIGVGARALEDATGGLPSGDPRKVAIGYNAAKNDETFGTIAVGFQTARDNTGKHATGLGYQAAQTNTGDSAVGVGSFSAQNNSGKEIVAVGDQSAQTNTGNDVIALGYEAATDNTGNSVTAVGCQAAAGDGLSDPSTMGDDNIGIGKSAIRNNQASGLIAIGQHAGENAQTDDQLIITQRDGTRRMVMDLTTGDLSITGTLTENATL